MRVFRDLQSVSDSVRHGAVSIGNFDGVHLGHARIVKRLVAEARALGGAAVVWTFDPFPAQVLRPDRAPAPLTWLGRRVELLASLGVDAVIAYPTDEAFLRLEPRGFFQKCLRDALAARVLVEGPNFFFGHDRKGNIELLGEFCRQAGMTLRIVEPMSINGQMVSSSRVRALVHQGRVEEARRLLIRPYQIHGTVERGAGRGTGLGFPTANLGAVDTLLPAEGIYAGRALADGRDWPAAISVGPNPTFDEGTRKVEVHLVGFQGDLYDRELAVDFIARLREIRKFRSASELVTQMVQDVEATKALTAAFLA